VEFICDSPAIPCADVYVCYVDVHLFSKTGKICVSIPMSGWSMAIKESIFSIKLAVSAGAGGGFWVASAYVRGFECADVVGVGVGS
jgi:hypothetical protein